MDLKTRFPHKIEGEGAGTRLDSYLQGILPEISRSRWARLVDEGTLRVDGQTVKPSHKLKVGQEISVEADARIDESDDALPRGAGQATFSGVAPTILFEDEDLLVLDKPAGLTVHPGAGVAVDQTLVGWLLTEGKVNAESPGHLAWGDDLLEERRPGIVHRLDRGTSGTLVVAKHPSAHAKLASQFADRSAGRFYWALSQGDASTLGAKAPPRLAQYLREHQASVAFRISRDGIHSFASLHDRDPRERQRFAVVPKDGRKAISHFRLLDRSEGHSLLELKLETGRTHQIRVHLSFLGLPIAGDLLYGGQAKDSAPRLMLHAHTLFFEHPRSGKALSFHAPWPADAARRLLDLGFDASSVRPPLEDLWRTWNSILPKAGPKT
jgi:23S rRNA pseudouridine1911/1915/1917 synthase